MHLSSLGWIISGLLVGIGTRLTGGLTGGHAYCSAPVLNRRSIMASVAATVAAFLIATIRYHYPFLIPNRDYIPSQLYLGLVHWATILLYIILACYSIFNMCMLLIKESGFESSEALAAFLVGLLYGGGLMIGGALRPSIVIGFLTLDLDAWNPTLLVLMITVTMVNLIVFMLIIGQP